MLVDFIANHLSVSRQTLAFLGGFFLVTLTLSALIILQSNRKKLFFYKIKNISSVIKREDKAVERAKIFAKVIEKSNQEEKASFKQLLKIQLKGITNKNIFYKLILINLTIILLVFWISSANVYAIFFTAPPVFFLTLRWLVNKEKKSYTAQVVNQLPASLELLVRSLEAGLNTTHAFSMCATQLDEPIKSEFYMINRDLISGLSTPEAVEKFYERVPIPPVAFFLALISAQNKSGGSLASGLKVLAQSLRERRSVENKLQAMTSEPRTSMKVLLAIPGIFTIISFFIQTEQMIKLFTTSEGQIYLVPMLSWALIGVFIMLKMTDLGE